MQYVVLTRKTLEVRVRSRPGPLDLTIRVPPRSRQTRMHRVDHPMSDAILYGVLYPARYAADRRSGRRNVKYMLAPPEPWLVAIGAVMWEGIVQGLSWDVVKVSVKGALGRLQHAGIAPLSATEKQTSSTELGFRWTRYAGGRKQREMFIGLRRKYAREIQRRKVSRLKVKTGKSATRPRSRGKAPR